MRKELIQSHTAAVAVRGIQESFVRQYLEATNMATADYDEDQWTQVGAGNLLVGGEEYKELPEEQLARLRAAAWRAYYNNPHARGIIRNTVNFILGKGAEIKFDSDLSEAELAPAIEEWERFEKAVKWRRKQKETVRRTLRDGETFHRFMDAKKDSNSGEGKPVTFHYIEPDWIASNDPKISYGIETEPDNVGVIKSYRLIPPVPAGGDGKAKEETLKPSEIQHIKINVDENVKRGRSVLEPILADLEEYKQFRKFRTILNKARTAIVMVRRMSGAPSVLNSQVQAQKTTGTRAANNRLKAPRAGTQITIDRESEIEFKSPNLGASEAEIDGRSMTLAMAAGMSLPEFVISGDASNNNFASIKQAIVTAIKYIEDMQSFFGEEFEEIFDRVIEGGKKAGRIPPGLEVKASFEFPVFDIRDLLQEVQAYNNLYTMGVISKSTAAGHFGFNYEEEVERMEKDNKMDPITRQFLKDLENEDNPDGTNNPPDDNKDDEEPDDTTE